MELDEVADELYGLRPQEFTVARNDRAQRARADGQRELAQQIRGLRRPTLAAWASNLLVREHGEQVAPLLRLGEELRGAHRELDGSELRTLSHRQHQLVGALAKQAQRLASDAGQPLGPQAQQELAQTLHAVLADPDAGREWAAGRLSRPLTAGGGFDAAAREAAAAPPVHRRRGSQQRAGTAAKGPDVRARKQAEQAAKTASRAAREAAEAADRRRREADAAREESAAAREAREEADERVERLRTELRAAEESRKHSRSREREAERAERDARRRAEEAEQRARRNAGTSESRR